MASDQPQVTVTRRLHFSAAHRVHSPEMSDDENRRVFGKCNNPNWHGHNYILDVSVTGSIDAKTGYVIDLSRVKQIVEERVIQHVDHRLQRPGCEGNEPDLDNGQQANCRDATAVWPQVGKRPPDRAHAGFRAPA